MAGEHRQAFCKSVPFPLQMIGTQKFAKIAATSPHALKVLVRSGRMRFERNGQPLHVHAHFAVVWIASGLEALANEDNLIYLM